MKVPKTPVLAAVALVALALTSATAQGAPPPHPDQGTTKRQVLQQAIAESGVRTTHGNRMAVSAGELAAVTPDSMSKIDPKTGKFVPMPGMVMDAAPTVVSGPTGLAPNVGGQWTDFAFKMPNAPVAPGTVSSPGAIHTVQLSTGKVLISAGSGNQWQNLPAGKFVTWLWDPSATDQTTAWKQIPTPYDMFCAGHTILPNGNVLIAGGTTAYPQFDNAGNLVQDWAGSAQSYIFDITSETFVKTGAMGSARWYPTIVATGDGKQVVVSGLDDKAKALGVVSHYTNTVEQFDPATSAWSALPSMDFTTNDPSTPTTAGATNSTRTFGYYPGLVLTESGKLFYSGESNGDNGIQSGLWDYRTGAFTNAGQLPMPYTRNAGATVLLPPAQDQKVMVMGGGDYGLPSTADTELINLKGGALGPWVKGPPLSAAKMYVGAVVLPDYTVFETNGASQFRQGGVHTAEIYNPATNAFTVMNSPQIDRLYHSEAFLRPDGSVITLGSQPLDGTFVMDISVYKPPYLFKGARPSVTGGVNAFDYSGAAKGPFTITTAPGTTVAKVSLVRPSATTHSTDPDQRLVDMTVTRNANGTYNLAAPATGNMAPPGRYMLFATDNTGVPSVATWVSIGGAAGTPPPPPPPPPPTGGRTLTLTDTMTAWEGHFTATSSIKAAGQDIKLQILTNGVWTYATNHPSDANGVSTFIWGGGNTSQFRAELPAAGTTPETISPTVTVAYGP